MLFDSKKKVLMFFVITTLIFGLCGCDLQSEITLENDQRHVTEAVNNQVNIFSTGYFKNHNKWLYLDNYYDNSAYRMSLDGENFEKLLDDVTIISLTDNYLFGYSFFNKVLKRMNVLDGTKIEFKVNGTYFVIDGEWIYFSNNDDNKNLYKIKIDGSGLTKLNDDYTVQITVFEDVVYYINNSEMRLYKIEKDGGNKQKLSNSDCYNFQAFSEKIFYSGLYDFYKVNHNGSNETLILENTDIILSNYVDGWIYYTNLVDYNGKPYKMRDDGTDNQKVIESYKYYTNRADGNKLYKISEGGTDDQKITDEWVGSYFIEGEYIYYNVSQSGKDEIWGTLYKKHEGKATEEDLKFIKEFFTQRNDLEGAIFRIKLNGTEKISIP